MVGRKNVEGGPQPPTRSVWWHFVCWRALGSCNVHRATDIAFDIAPAFLHLPCPNDHGILQNFSASSLQSNADWSDGRFLDSRIGTRSVMPSSPIALFFPFPGLLVGILPSFPFVGADGPASTFAWSASPTRALVPCTDDSCSTLSSTRASGWLGTRTTGAGMAAAVAAEASGRRDV
ncbi:hypothetical protein B0H21DRAFT_242774 [Amylocystis lapponica]|nr:hypothetical protein B0H21DRAFT_242774 [Amylocystis lapponica]